MSDQYFSIQRLSFNISFPSKEGAHELQNRISAIYHHQIHATLQRFFNRIIPENILIRKDCLLLDIGSISYELLETELPGRLQAALEEQFSSLLSSAHMELKWERQGFETLPAATGFCELLETYLLTGTSPWQTSLKNQFTWQFMLQDLYTSDPEQLYKLLKDLGRQQTVRKRLAFQAERKEAELVIRLLLPSESPAIIAYKRKILRIQQQQQIIKTSQTEFTHAVVFFIFTYLMEESGSLFSRKALIRSLLFQMAGYYNISFTDLLTVLYEALPEDKVKVNGGSSLFELVHELQNENRTAAGNFTPRRQKETTQTALKLSEKLERLQYYLLWGTFPVWAATTGREELIAFLAEGIKSVPVTVKEMILSFTGNTAAVERIRHLLPAYDFSGLSSTASAVNGRSSNAADTYRTLEDVLDYFLRYGFMPWWKQEYSRISPEKLLKKLLLTSAFNPIRMLKSAGIQQQSRTRFLFQFSEDTIYQLFSFLPHWMNTMLVIETIIELIESVPMLTAVKQPALKRLILETAWMSYAHEEYRFFNESYFYRNIFEQVSRRTTTEKSRVFELLSTTVRLRKIESPVMNNHYFENALTDSMVSATEKPVESIRYGSLDALLMQYTGVQVIPSADDRQQQVVQLLEYYLTWNRMPDQVTAMNSQELDLRIEEMLLLLYHQDRDSLKRILNQNNHTAGSRMHLHQLFLPDRRGGDHKQLSLLLDEYIEQDALIYVKEMAIKGDLTIERGLKPVLDRLLEKAKDGVTEELAQLLQSAPLTKYMARTYGDETMRWLIENSSGSNQLFRQQSTAMRNLILSMLNDTPEKKQLSLLLNEATLFYIYGGAHTKTIKDYIRAVFHFLSGAVYTALELFRLLLHKIDSDPHLRHTNNPLVEMLRQELRQQLDIRRREEETRKKTEQDECSRRETLAIQQALQQKIEQELMLKKEQEELSSGKNKPLVLEKGHELYVNNAGLILLHPFLGTYFQRLNLKLTDPVATTRAVHLLQYLVYKTNQHPEQELVLNKILCGYAIQEPLPLEIEIEQHEADLSEELLQVVIQRSGKLSNSSVDGFRASFLQREGMLTEADDAWTLRVEQRGYDLILQTLPWAFGMVKFQWMNKPLLIEWI